MQKKIQKIFFELEIIAFELVALKTPFTKTEYFSSAVNMVTDGLKISDTTKTEVFEVICFRNDEKTWQKSCGADLRSLSGPSTSWLSISVLTGGFLDI